MDCLNYLAADFRLWQPRPWQHLLEEAGVTDSSAKFKSIERHWELVHGGDIYDSP